MNDLIGESDAIQKLRHIIEQVAPTDATILITGETGTGKELVARAIHEQSRRADEAYIAINCPGLTETLIESELFGHEKGAFTDARERHYGKFEQANRGTIFLDEIGSLGLNVQAKLLRVLQERSIQRVGGKTEIPVDIRLISACNGNFQLLIDDGKFRRDLYHRLNVIHVHIPPLRERIEDLKPLIAYYQEQFEKQHRRRLKGFDRKSWTYLQSYNWPGNIRELRNLIESLTILHHDEMITLDDLPMIEIKSLYFETAVKQFYLKDMTLNDATNAFQREYILYVMAKTGRHKIQTAKHLGLHRNTLLTKCIVLQIDKEMACRLPRD